MNDLFWALYWIDVLGNFTGSWLFGTMMASVFLCLPVALLVAYKCDVRGIKEFPLWPNALTLFATFLVSAAFCFIPSKSTMYLMLGVQTTANVMESDVGKKLTIIVNKEMDALLKKYTDKEQK